MILQVQNNAQKGLNDSPYEEGEDIAEILGITKWESPEVGSPSMTKGNFPTHLISKTDEDNYKSNMGAISEYLAWADENKDCCVNRHFMELVLTKKLDGTSATFIIDQAGEFHVCSRSLDLKDVEGNLYWEVAKKYNIEEKLRNWKRPIAIQGEICGPKIQNNPLILTEKELYLFNVKDLEEQKYLSWDFILDFCREFKLKPVPEVARYRYWAGEFLALDDIQKMANEVKYPGGGHGEGLVMRTNFPWYSRKLQKNFSVKFISEPYDLKKK